MPNNSVTGIAQTPDGYIWLATPVGLARFDGLRFEEVERTNYVAEPNRGVLVLISSHSGGLWLAMDRSPIVRLNSGKPEVFATQAGLPDRTAQKLVEGPDGVLWIAYRNGTVCRIRKGKVTSFGAAQGVPRALSYALAIDNQGRVWLAANRELHAFGEEGFHQILEADGPITALSAASGKGIWLCAGRRLYKYDRDLEVIGAFDADRSETAANLILEDRDGTVWIGTTYSGLVHFDGLKFETVPTSARGIASLMQDREGNLWVGMSAGGLNRISVRAVELEGGEPGSPFEPVQSISEGANGILWGATHSGQLVRRDQHNWTVVPTPGGDAMCVAADAKGAVWVGTRNRQLYRWQDERFAVWGRAEGLEGRILHGLLAASNGDLWIGGPAEAVQRLRDGTLATIRLPRDTGAVRAMAEGREGEVWIGTARGALFRINAEVVTDETSRLSMELMSIRALHAAKDGSLWIGYAGWGLGRLKDGRLSRLTVEQGLHENYISQIVSDDHGSLWCAGDHGLFSLRHQELERVFAGRSARVHSIHYGLGEGFPALQGGFGFSPGALKSRDGRLWIPMQTALAAINPEKLRDNREAPPVVLSRVTVDGRTLGWYRGVLPEPQEAGTKVTDLRAADAVLRLQPGHRRLEFEFTSLSFGAPENVHFRYALEGFDEDWIDAQTQRRAGYSRLPAGEYRFRVTACNREGLWNENSASLAVIVAPFFWQTWWFRIIGGAVFISLFVGVGRYVSFRRLRLRLQTLEQQAALGKERARIARDIHDDLGTRLSEITLLSELALQDEAKPENARAHVRHISAAARLAADSMDEIVWAANPRNDSLPHLVSYIGQFALQFLQMARIGCRLDLPDQPPKWALSAETRHNLFLVTKEALNNIVRHSEATEVRLRISVAADLLELSIDDNGRGFVPAPDNPSADGLRNMRQRMGDIGGDCRIESQPGCGTRVYFSYAKSSRK